MKFDRTYYILNSSRKLRVLISCSLFLIALHKRPRVKTICGCAFIGNINRYDETASLTLGVLHILKTVPKFRKNKNYRKERSVYNNNSQTTMYNHIFFLNIHTVFFFLFFSFLDTNNFSVDKFHSNYEYVTSLFIITLAT